MVDQEDKKLNDLIEFDEHKKGRIFEEYNVFFYALVSQDTVEMYYSIKPQSFLINQSYSYKVITRLGSEEDNLFYSTKEEQRQLLERVLLQIDPGEKKEFTGQIVPSTTSVNRRVGTINSLSGADGTTYMEVKKKSTTNGTTRSNKPKRKLFRKYRKN
jgi:DNA excision repair protein ERCC-3